MRLSSFIVAAFVSALTGLLHAQATPTEPAPPAASDKEETKPCAARTTVSELPKDAVQWDVDSQFIAYERESLIEGYRKHGARNSEWNDKAEQFLEYALRWFGDWEREGRDAVWAEEGGKLVKAGCNDALVQYFAARMQDEGRSLNVTRARYQKAENALEHSSYPRNHLAVLRYYLSEHRRAWRDEPGRTTALAGALDTWIESLREQHARGVHPRYQLWGLSAFVNEYLPTAAARELIDRCERDTAIDPWVALTLDGFWHLRHAWELRTNAWAEKVTEQQWNGFREQLREARASLTKAHALAPDRPEAAAAMVKVAAGQDEHAEQRRWFDTSRRAQLDYLPAYGHYIWFIRPRWGGSLATMLAFGRECAATDRYDTAVPFQFCRAITDVCSDLDDFETVWKSPGLLEQCHEILVKSAEQTRRKGYRNWYLTYGAAQAWWAQRYTEGYKLAQKADFDFREAAATTFRIPVDLLQRDTLTFGGPAQDLFKQATEAGGREDFEVAAQLCAKAVEQCKDAPTAVRDAARSRAASSRMYADFVADRWVPLDLGGDLAAFRKLSGSWRPSEDNGGLLWKNGDGELRLASYARFGRNLELETTIRFRRKPNEVTTAAILLGFDWTTGTDARWQAITLTPVAGTGVIGAGIGAANGTKFQFELPENRELRMRVLLREDNVTVSINDKVVSEGEIPPARDSWVPGDYIGFYAFANRASDEIEFREARVRRVR